MALIACPECQKQISDQATACPQCGYPLRERQQQQAAPTPPPVKRPARPPTPAQRREETLPKASSGAEPTPSALVALNVLKIALCLCAGVVLFFFVAAISSGEAIAQLLVLAVVIWTSVWVGIDATRLMRDIPKEELKKISSATTTTDWVAGCLLLWIVCLPWYLVTRSKYIAYHNARNPRD